MKTEDDQKFHLSDEGLRRLVIAMINQNREDLYGLMAGESIYEESTTLQLRMLETEHRKYKEWLRILNV